MSDNPLIPPTSRLVIFLTPIMKGSVNFEACFHSSSGEQAPAELVHNLTTARSEIYDKLLKPSGAARSIIDAIDVYLPLIWQLMTSLENQPPVRLECSLLFEWKGALNTVQANLGFSAFPDIIYELIMMLHTKAIVLANYAAEILLGDVSASNQSGKHFREASGIMMFLAAQLIPRWQNYGMPRPLECDPEVCRFMSSYFDACAHQMAIIKSTLINSPPSVLAGLCVAGNFNMARSLESLAFSVREEVRNTCFDRNLQVHIGYMREYLSALSYYYFAQDLIVKTETGQAIAMCNMCQQKLLEQVKQPDKRYNPTLQGMPRKSSPELDTHMRDAIYNLNLKADEIRVNADNENRMIYFKPVPRDLMDMMDLPKDEDKKSQME